MAGGTRLGDVGDLPWLLNGDGTHCTGAVRHLLDAAGVRPAIVASVDDNRALLRLVAAGLGACVVPALVLAGSVEDVTVASQGLGATRTIVAVTRRSSGGRADDVVAALRAAADDAAVRRDPARTGRSRPTARRGSAGRRGRAASRAANRARWMARTSSSVSGAVVVRR